MRAGALPSRILPLRVIICTCSLIERRKQIEKKGSSAHIARVLGPSVCIHSPCFKGVLKHIFEVIDTLPYASRAQRERHFSNTGVWKHFNFIDTTVTSIPPWRHESERNLMTSVRLGTTFHVGSGYACSNDAIYHDVTTNPHTETSSQK